MPKTKIEGVELNFELFGPVGAPAVAITPGGRFSKDAIGVPQLGAGLAEAGCRVLLWDRPNTGASDLCFSGTSESAMQAGFLIKLIRELDLGPTALVGGSAGARVSLLAAKADPEVVSRMVLWWISGGLIGMMRLGSYYCCEAAELADQKGMAAVADMPIWAQQMAANPRGREIILAQDPRAFIAKMEEWAAGYVPSPDTPVGGISRADFGAMTMPAMILRGSDEDIYHPGWVCRQVSELMPNGQLIEPPWHIDVFRERMNDGTGLFSDWPLLAPQIIAFMQEAQ